MKKIVLIILSLVFILLLAWASIDCYKGNSDSSISGNTVYIDAEPTTADIGVYDDQLVLPANKNFYLKYEDGHVVDVVVSTEEEDETK